MRSIIDRQKSIIPACDVSLSKFQQIVEETHTIPEVGAYKIGAILALSAGLPSVVKIARQYTPKPLIYDHQKGGTDIPETGEAFVTTLKDCGIDAMIIFPFTGPATQSAWIQAAKRHNMPVIVGGHMTHDRFLASDGGYIEEQATRNIYTHAASHGITDYVVPGNKTSVINAIRELLVQANIDPVFYSPGFLAQGGKLTEAAAVAGSRWHAIIGRAIYQAADIHKTTQDLAKSL